MIIGIFLNFKAAFDRVIRKKNAGIYKITINQENKINIHKKITSFGLWA